MNRKQLAGEIKKRFELTGELDLSNKALTKAQLELALEADTTEEMLDVLDISEDDLLEADAAPDLSDEERIVTYLSPKSKQGSVFVPNYGRVNPETPVSLPESIFDQYADEYAFESDDGREARLEAEAEAAEKAAE